MTIASTPRDMISWNFNLSRPVSSVPPPVTTFYDGGAEGGFGGIYRILWSLTAVWDRVTAWMYIMDAQVGLKTLCTCAHLCDGTNINQWYWGGDKQRIDFTLLPPSPNFTAIMTTRSDIANRETPSSMRNDVRFNSVPFFLNLIHIFLIYWSKVQVQCKSKSLI